MNTEKEKIEAQLNKLPEVIWDRFAGDFSLMGIFGWIPRPDGKSDFVHLVFRDGFCERFATSSAEHSRVFARRLGFDGKNHMDCRRVEHFFDGVNAVKLK